MADRERDAPRTFREVGMMVYQLKEDFDELKNRMDRIVSVLVVSIVCPIVVGVVLALIIRH